MITYFSCLWYQLITLSKIDDIYLDLYLNKMSHFLAITVVDCVFMAYFFPFLIFLPFRQNGKSFGSLNSTAIRMHSVVCQCRLFWFKDSVSFFEFEMQFLTVFERTVIFKSLYDSFVIRYHCFIVSSIMYP